jgi:hypothetical protein
MKPSMPDTVTGRFATWRRRAAKLRTFGREEWSVLGESLFTLVGLSIALRVGAFPRVLGWAKHPGAPVVGEWPASRVQHVAWLVALASRVLGTRCLARSLTLTRILARRGVASELRIGVRPINQELEAHAWVEWKGTVLGDSPAGLHRYSAFESPIGDSSNA